MPSRARPPDDGSAVDPVDAWMTAITVGQERQTGRLTAVEKALDELRREIREPLKHVADLADATTERNVRAVALDGALTSIIRARWFQGAAAVVALALWQAFAVRYLGAPAVPPSLPVPTIPQEAPP